MNLRHFFAALFTLAGLVAAYLAVRMRAIEASSSWFFAVFAGFFFVLAASAAKPVRKKEPAPVKFVPAVFFDTAVLVLAILLGLAIAVCLLGRSKGTPATRPPAAGNAHS